MMTSDACAEILLADEDVADMRELLADEDQDVADMREDSKNLRKY